MCKVPITLSIRLLIEHTMKHMAIWVVNYLQGFGKSLENAQFLVLMYLLLCSGTFISFLTGVE